MFRNVLAAALRNLDRNRLYAAISILGLAVAMAAAMIAGLYIRDELSFDRFIPGSRQVYVLVGDYHPATGAPMVGAVTPAAAYGWLKEDFPEIAAAARAIGVASSVRQGETESLDPVAWVDPDFFKVLSMPVLAGDPDATMRRADGVVLTRSAALKYFGEEAPIGRTLELNRSISLRVGAVLKDLPANAHFKQSLFASGLAPLSAIRRADSPAFTLKPGTYRINATTYVRFNDEAAARRVQAAMRAFSTRRIGKPYGGREAAFLSLVPLGALHLAPLNDAVSLNAIGPPGNPKILAALGTVAVLILLMAGINFVHLTTSRAGQRMVEVGVRKLVGASRKHLFLQFLGEAQIYALLALLLATAAVELALPAIRAALDRPLAFAYLSDPALVAAVLSTTVLIGFLAGLYPALVQSGFRPAAMLKGSMVMTPRGLAVREGLVVSQCAVLIGLILSTAVVGAQTHFVMNEGLRLRKEQTLMLNVSEPPDFSKPADAPRRQLCREGFPELIRKLPGVIGAACSAGGVMDTDVGSIVGLGPNGVPVGMLRGDADYGLFELYGLKPVAGRFFSRPDDAIPNVRPYPPARVTILNETAVRALGFSSPAQAVGKSFALGMARRPVLIVGVVPDFEVNALQGERRPRTYFLLPATLDLLHVKLDGRRAPETLKAIEAAWRTTGVPRPPSYRFVDDYLRAVYVRVLKEGLVLDALCAIAIVIGCLGLFGLAAFTAERRTKEIGIRKAMGAGEGDILRLMLWSFTRPVLWANLIAWPVGWWAMTLWLQGFSTRIELSPLFFLGAGGAALLIAAVTVSAHAVGIARAKPAGALRYE